MHICLEPAGFLKKSRKGGHILHLDGLEPGLAEKREIEWDSESHQRGT